VNPPQGQLDTGLVERVPPRQDVVIHAVNERDVEVEQERVSLLHWNLWIRTHVSTVLGMRALAETLPQATGWEEDA
jgi:hypothetical protein